MVTAKWAAVPALMGMFAASTVAAAEFEPGEWDHRTDLLSASVPGIPQWLIKLVAGHASRRSCNSQAQLASHPEDLFKGDDAAVCTLRKLSLARGTIAFDTFCTNRRFPEGLLVSTHGTYTSTSYAIATVSTGTRNGAPVRITTQGTGRRISPICR